MTPRPSHPDRTPGGRRERLHVRLYHHHVPRCLLANTAFLHADALRVDGSMGVTGGAVRGGGTRRLFANRVFVCSTKVHGCDRPVRALRGAPTSFHLGSVVYRYTLVLALLEKKPNESTSIVQ